ncbi:hypothetical protein D3C78_1594830 [compost metagenome]
MELMTAIDTAAVARSRNNVGSAQNGDLKLYRPVSATQIIAIDATGLGSMAAPTRPRAATASGMAECSLRSLRRSELRDHTTIRMVATMYGSMAIRPIWVWVRLLLKPLMICGIQ